MEEDGTKNEQAKTAAGDAKVEQPNGPEDMDID